jgi:hypothetical protein
MHARRVHLLTWYKNGAFQPLVVNGRNVMVGGGVNSSAGLRFTIEFELPTDYKVENGRTKEPAH